MPGFNGMGPQGNGPFTGGGRGMCAQPGTGMAVGRGMGQGRRCGMGRRGAGGQGMGQGMGQGQGMGRGMGMSQGVAQSVGQGPAEPGAAMSPEEYVAWLEAELAKTRAKTGQGS
ncbi:DUF5320 domain-containing protein [Desulfovibrio sulfodismutans]|uniref:DUF5320 domain-containing protein n=1 Tax=Desulfolutivibrio sulfodismutans TaxID=63561 RepID=A0A7K3NN98_9BACT|nr:DUF5320 domain-containing protein [Desulfolutivibrio sulfodismutans]NDY57303.1 DUF5320 domain-containing protein [Desulfolutivibrio sulfodismutans]QLA13954.1 hypothetical protein GD606_17630 [Desulfolutivibrio sulfodismutans DSM 3696]